MSGCLERVDGEAVGGAAADLDVRELLPGGPVGAVAPLNLGIANISSGAATYIPPAGATTLLDSLEWERWTVGPGAGQTAGHRTGIQVWSRDAAFGGFHVSWLVHLRTLLNNAALGFRAYVGLAAQVAVLPAVNPSTFTNIVGFGFDPAAAPQWTLLHNDAAGPATPTPLGASFLAATTDVLFFEVEADPGGADFRCRARNLTTPADTGVLLVNTNVPAAASLFSDNAWYNTNADATTAAQIELARVRAIRPPVPSG